jgi:hypothetical protein
MKSNAILTRSVLICVIFTLGIITKSSAQCDPGLVPYTLVLADESETAFPTDISWVVSSSNQVVAGQLCPDYTGGVFELCLLPGETYTFTAWDDFGDGWGFPEGTTAWSIFFPDGSLAFAGESPDNSEPGDSSEDCAGFDTEFSLTFTAIEAFTCTPPVFSVETERNCNESTFDAVVTIEETNSSVPLLILSAQIDGEQVDIGSVINIPGQSETFSNLPLDTDIVFTVNTITETCPVSEIVNVSSENCFVSLTCGEAFETTYCYENFDNSVFAYQSPEGEPVSLVFTQGLIEPCCDNITIYDGTDFSGEVLFSGNNNGNLANVSVTANSGALFMTISADFIGSCESESFGTGEWTWFTGCGDFDISGCTDPDAINYNPEATIDNGSCIAPAVNDEACGALTLDCNADPIAGNFDMATTNGDLDNCVSIFQPSTGDLWFTFEADGTSLYTISAGDISDLAIALYRGDDCENLTEVKGCAGASQSFTGDFEAGTYYFLVRPYSYALFNNFYSVSLTCIPGCSDPFPAVDEETLVTEPANRKVNVSWMPLKDQIGCQVQIREAGGALVGIKTVAGPEAGSYSIPVAMLALGADYEWRVRCGCSQSPLIAGPWSSWQAFTTPGGLGIAVNPNPTAGPSNVSFTTAKEEYATLEVFDMTGKMVEALFAGAVQPNTDYRFEFDGSALPDGVYIYRLTTETESINEKFIIAR